MTTGPAMAMARRVCANHHERTAHAVCMSCRKDVCGECATEWDGINYCVSCLAARRQGEPRGATWLAVSATLLACALLLALTAELMVWSGALLGGLR